MNSSTCYKGREKVLMLTDYTHVHNDVSPFLDLLHMQHAQALLSICPSLPLVDDHDEDGVVYTCLTGVALAAAAAAAQGGGLSAAQGRANAGFILGLAPDTAAASTSQRECLQAIGEAMQRATMDEEIEEGIRVALKGGIAQLAAVM